MSSNHILKRSWSPFLFIAGLVGLRKKKQAWGTVYDSVTKQPLDPAYVVVYDMLGREVASSITDLDGRYGFVLPAGVYRIEASKTNYEFPSKKLFGKVEDEVYQNLYFGGNIAIIDDEQVISENIPMDPLALDWNQAEKARRKLGYFRGDDFNRLATILFSFGFAISFLTFVLGTGRIYTVLFGLYAGFYFAKILFVGKAKKASQVVSLQTRAPIPFALVRVYTAAGNHEIMKKVTSYAGTFFCLVPNGNYFLKFETRNQDGSYTPAYTSNVFTVTNGTISKTFAI